MHFLVLRSFELELLRNGYRANTNKILIYQSYKKSVLKRRKLPPMSNDVRLRVGCGHCIRDQIDAIIHLLRSCTYKIIPICDRDPNVSFLQGS